MHAALGGIALITGFISMVAKKGKTIHKKSGLLFFYSMMLSGIIALVVAVLPKHESPFLFAVGIFSLYFVLTGKRALHFKLEKPDLRVDKWISKIMILTGVLMILLPIVLTKRIHIVLVVFAIIGIVFSVRDLKLFKNPEQLRKGWLKLHLGKMIGGYISATTAFVVVNEYFPSFYGWFIPGIIGGFIITYWMRKLKTKTIANTSQN
jgi:hypothetical protein